MPSPIQAVFCRSVKNMTPKELGEAVAHLHAIRRRLEDGHTKALAKLDADEVWLLKKFEEELALTATDGETS